MYNINRGKINDILAYMRKNVFNIEQALIAKQEDVNIINLAIERVMHIVIESIIDVGNLIIDGFIMRDPGSYLDIIEILFDEKVIPEEDAQILKEIISCRKILVNDYTKVNSKQITNQLIKALPTILKFEERVQNYLKQELG